jgi:hypothetical protein
MAVGQHNTAEVSSDPFNRSTQPLPLSSRNNAGESAVPSVGRGPKLRAGGRPLCVLAHLVARPSRDLDSVSRGRLTCVFFRGQSRARIRG